MSEKLLELVKPALAVLVLVVLIFLLPWGMVSWGKIESLPASTITVTGTSKLDKAPQTATYMATVSIANDDKDAAVSAVNKAMDKLITAVKDFGIAEADIQTSQVSVYENVKPEIMIYPPQGRGEPTKKWQASNSITIKLKDISKASALTDLLNSSGATSVSGPNFAIEDRESSDAELLAKAIEDARTKADVMAKAGGRKLGKMITVSEGFSSYPIPYTLTAEKADSRAVAAPIEPGTETLTKSVTVIFELR